MKRKSLVTILIMTLVLSIVLAFSSCSSENNITFSSSISSDDVTIWYECQNQLSETTEEEDLADDYIIEDSENDLSEAVTYGRETRVIWVKVYKDGKLSSYTCQEGTNLGYFSKMTDEEILEDLEDTDKYVVGQKDEDYNIYLYTDAAGQNVQFEGVPARVKTDTKSDANYFMTLVSTDTIPTFQVYDSYYGGFELYNYDETLFGEAVLVTRCNENDTFALDEADLEGAIVDYKTPLEVLTELNNPEEASDNEDSEDASEEASEETSDVDTEDSADTE